MSGKFTFVFTVVRVLLIAGFFILSRSLFAANTESAPKVVLVELFTSEGCSSCPPADELLRKINGMQTTAGQLIVGISEHVTYWNSQGWFDPFSASAYTDRQNAYKARFGLESVYTPQMVINGSEQIVGSDRAGLIHAIEKEQGKPSSVLLRITSTALAGPLLTVKFSASGEASVHNADIIAVLTDDTDQSSVLHGENSGRTLTHVAVARSISRVAKLRPVGEQTVDIRLPLSFREPHGHHLILFVEVPGNGPVLGVDTKPF